MQAIGCYRKMRWAFHIAFVYGKDFLNPLQIINLFKLANYFHKFMQIAV